MGAAAAPIAIGLTVGSKLIGAKAQVDGYRAAAGADDVNARQELALGARQEETIDEQARATAGDAVVAAGMNGGGVGTGSALDALRQTAINAQLDRLNVRATAGSRANAYYAQARQERAQAKGALIKGLLGAGASALTGATGAGLIGPQAGGGGQATGALPSSVGSSMPLPDVSVMSGYSGGF